MPSSSPLRCSAALSTLSDPEAAIRAAAEEALAGLPGRPDLALVFCSARHAAAADRIASLACDTLQTEALLGCTGESIVANAREIEEEPAVAVWLAKWPGAKITPLSLQFERTREGGVIQGWPEDSAGDWPADTFLILLGEPFSFPTDHFLERLNEDRPGVPVVGGMASGAAEPGENRLLFGRQTLAEGAVAALVSGPVRVRTVVSQGCRPVGRPLVVTKAERNVIQELGGRPALLQLKEIFDVLPTRDQRLVQKALHVGRVVSEYRDHFEQGDFLVRNVVGIDPNTGAIAVGDYLRPGQTIQFHVRDQEAADGELKQLLAAARRESQQPAGALVFTCNGRGTRMFSGPNHDAGCLAEAFGPIPAAGFFAAGEIGPVGKQNFTHGFTASVAVFEPA
ncbi:MAG: FIST N-terminal domain-containing protein [Pirellulaceae bacterium]|nr:FIST N-terminal domain-containing protein [Pirellulaceae bacterium]